jgi:hypothetical protein
LLLGLPAILRPALIEKISQISVIRGTCPIEKRASDLIGDVVNLKLSGQCAIVPLLGNSPLLISLLGICWLSHTKNQ